MKRIIGLLLVLTMLMGIVGVTTTAAAAESADVPVLGAISVDDGGVITLEVTGLKPDYVYVEYRTEDGYYAGSASLKDPDNTGKYTGKRDSYYADEYPDAVISEFEAYRYDGDSKIDEASKTLTSTNENTYFNYNKDKALTQVSKTENVGKGEQHSWKYNGEECTDYATTSIKEVQTTVSYENGKEIGTTVTTTKFAVKLAKDPERYYINGFSQNDFNYTVLSGTREEVSKGTQKSTSSDGKLTTTTTSDLKTTYKLAEKESKNSDGTTYKYRSFDPDSMSGTKTVATKGTRESYYWTWDEETGGYDKKVLDYTETVDEVETSTYEGTDRTVTKTVNNKTKDEEDGSVTEKQSETTSTAKYVERESYYNSDGKEKAWETTDKKSESKTTYYRSDGTKSQVTTRKEENTQTTTKQKSSGSDYFWWQTNDVTSKSQEIRETYDTKGAYSGKTVSEGESEFDVETGITLKNSSRTERYNKDDVQTSETETDYTNTLNTAKDARRYDYTSSTVNYSDKGLKTSSSTTSKLTEYKRDKDEDGDWNSWETTTSKSETNNYNRDDKLKKVSQTNETYNKDGSSTSTTTTKNYNTFTGAMTSENTSTEKWDAEGNYTSDASYTYNNDDGSLRRKYVRNADGSETHYNNKGEVVATRDKSDMDGTWKDGSGNVIGKNNLYSSEDYTGESTSISFKTRTGEISGIGIYKVERKDGVTTRTNTGYNADGKQTYLSVTEEKEDGSYTTTTDGVLRESYDAEKHETKYYDYKGNVNWTHVWDPETGEEREYNYKGTLVSKYLQTGDGSGTRWYYDEDGAVTSREVYGDYSVAYYDGKDNLRWSEETIHEGDESYRVYKDKDGKEFARTFSKHEDTSTDDVYSYTQTEQKMYWSGRDDYSDYDSGTTSLQKSVMNYSSSTVDGVYTQKDTTDYTKWHVENGVKGNEVTRKEESVYTSDENGSERTTKQDGVVTYHSVSEYNDYGDVIKTTNSYYDSYTGQPTSTSKDIWSDVPDSPVSYGKYYDQYGNLQTYSVTDDTDDWNWRKTYYADGTLKQDSWEDQLDYNSSSAKTYYLSGELESVSTQNGKVSQEIRYNKDGSYSYWADTVDGVTNAWLYDNKGNLTGYRWNETSVYDDEGEYGGEEVYSSYEYWDANSKLIYKYEDEQLASGWTQTYSDDAGNKLVYTSEDGWTLTVASGVKDGWINLFGSWFYLENGTPVQYDWKQIDGAWYYFNSNGMMRTGFVGFDYTDTGAETVYAMNKDGQLATGGWTQLNEEGTRWAYTDADGKVITGWQQIGGNWYYFNEGWTLNSADYKEDYYWSQSSSRGAMMTGAVKIWNSDWATKHTYFFNEDGTWDTTPGWKVADNFSDIEYHYYDESGREVTGWKQIDGNWYYFNNDGVLRNGWVNEGPNWYFMDPAQKGAMATDGWVEDKFEDWYYMNADGSMVTGWVLDNGTWYYMNADGAMAHDEWVGSGSDWYYMDASGQIETGWLQKGKTWYYLDDSGLMVTGWKLVDGTWYYFNSDGSMKHDSWLQDGGSWYYLTSGGSMAKKWAEIDGQWELFDENGVWQYTWDGE